MADELMDYLGSHPAGDFEPTPFYNPSDDTISILMRDADWYARRIDEVLTYFFTSDGDHFVGFELKGVTRLIAQYGELGMRLHAKPSVGEILAGYTLTFPSHPPLENSTTFPRLIDLFEGDARELLKHEVPIAS